MAEGRKKKFIKELLQKPKVRRESGLYVVDGPKMCGELPPEEAEEIFVTQDFLSSKYAESCEGILRSRGYEIVTEQEMRQMSDTVTPQGILALARQKRVRGLRELLELLKEDYGMLEEADPDDDSRPRDENGNPFDPPDEIALYLGVQRQDVVFAMDAMSGPVSLYDPVYTDGGESICVMDQVKDSKNTDEMWLERIALKEAVSRLSQREQKILAMRFYQSKTQMEVSEEIGISQAQVSRLEKNALKQIRKEL